MWSRFTGKSDSGSSASNRDKDDDSRRRRTGDSTRSKRERDLDARSVVSSTSTRKPSRRDTAPSSIASFVTAFDDMPRARANDDLYDDPRDERSARRRDDRPTSYAASSVSTTRRDRSRSRDRDEKDRKKSKDKEKDKKTEKRRSTRSEQSGSMSQAGGYRGDIVESPKPVQRSFSGQIASDGFSPFPGQAGAPMMSGALPTGSRPPTGGMSSHVQDQFPGQDPVQYATSALPGGNPFGAAADFYNDQGQSVHQQPGVRPQPPSVIIGQDTPHLMAAAAHANPVADTGSGAAADFYGTSTNAPPSKPPRPSSSTMPGAFIEEGPAPQKPPRPSKSDKPVKPAKPSKFGPAALAGGAALGYAIGHSSSNNQPHTTSYSSSNVQHSTSNSNGVGGSSASLYHQVGNPSATATDGSGYLPAYSGASYGTEDVPPQKPPRPGKPEKQSSGSNAGLYAAGAAGLAAYGLHKHNSHSHSQHSQHNYSSSTPGAFPGQQYNGIGPSPSPFMTGGMAQRHQHTGPVSRFVDWWKDYEDVQKMEEYTEYIGVCRGCFDPQSNIYDAPRKHHYNKRRSNEYMRPSGGIEKQSRYSLKEKKSHSSLSSGDERRRRTNNSAAGWVAAGLGGIGLAKAGQAIWNAGQNDFDDTYSIKSGRESTKTSRRSRSRSRDRKSYSYGNSEIRRRSRSRDRMSQMSVGITKDKKDYKIIRRRSRSRSRSSSSSRDGKSGLIGTAIGAGLAGAVLGAATKKKNRSRSRSRSPRKVYVQHNRRDSSGDERRRRRSQQLRRKSSRSSVSGASVIEIGQTHQSQGGFLGGFFAAPPPKEKHRKTSTASHKKKKKGFFNFGNASTSSSDSEMAFGTGYVRRRRRASPKRRNSEERLKATLAGLGATAAAIAAAKAGKSASKRHSEVVAVKEHRHSRKSSDRPRPGSRYGDDEWEDLPDDGTSDSSSDAGLVYGDWRNGKSQESLASNGSGTNKWGWRWGFGKKKRRSSNNLYDNIASTSLIGPTAAGAAGALTGAAIGTGLGRHDSESSSVHTLQSVYPVAPNDPTASFDARRTSSVPTPQPLITSGPGSVSIQQPQPVHQVPGAIYSTQPSSQAGYVVPAGPPVFSQDPFQSPHPTQFQTQNVIVQTPQHSGYPPGPRRANSSPIQSSSWKRDAAIAGLAATAGAAAIAAAKSGDRPLSESGNVRFSLTEEQTAKEEREWQKQLDRRDEEENRRRDQQRREDQSRREDEARRAEEERLRRDQLRREEDARRAEEDRRRDQLRREDEARQEDERRRRELQRQQEEARKYIEAERLAKIENERRLDERRREQEDIRAREAREAEERDRQERDARAEAKRRADLEVEAEQMRRERRETERRELERLKAREAEERDCQERDARAEAKRREDLEAEAEQMRRERRETERREIERLEASRHEAEIREDTDRRRREREAQEYSSRYESDRERRKLEQQRTGSSVSSVATDVRRKEKELEERERDIVQPDTWKATAAGAVAAGAAAAITSAAISSYKDKGKRKDKPKGGNRDRGSSAVKTMEPSAVKPVQAPSTVKAYEPSNTRTYEPSNVKTYEASNVRPYDSNKVKTYEPSNVKTYEPSNVMTFEPSRIEQDYFDDEIFDPNMFKKKDTPRESVRDVYRDWEDRYNEKPVSQADFFAPKELLEKDNLPKVRPVDPNEGATDLHISQAHDEATVHHPMVPPYPVSYSFTATKDGRSALGESWTVPSLNLIQPTPPGSRAPSVRSVSVPPSPNIEPIKEEPTEPKQERASRAGSRVSWGENQFHHFEVHTPDSYREQFVSDRDVEDLEKKHPQDEVTIEHETPESGNKTSTYQPQRREEPAKAPEPKEIAPSTQFVRDQDDSTWDSIVGAATKKSSKKDKKKAKAAAAAAATAAALTTAAVRSRDDRDENVERDYKQDTSSVISNPFTDSHAAPSTVASSIVAPSSVASSIPSTSSVYQSPHYTSVSDLDLRKPVDRKTETSGFVEGEVTAEAVPMHIPGSFDEASVIDKPAEEDWEAPTKTSKKGKKDGKSTDDTIVVQEAPRRVEPPPVPAYVPEPAKEVAPEPEVKLSKKDKKKKAKAAKRLSVDSWEESDVSLSSTPVVERDIRDIEPIRSAEPIRESTHTKDVARSGESSSSSSNKVAAAAMAGGFAALVGSAMKQDQDRMASDLEHARQNLESAAKYTNRESPASPPNGTHTLDDTVQPNTTPSTAFQDIDDLTEVKTPQRKKDKRRSSGKFSPTIGSPLRTETKYEDYMGTQRRSFTSNEQPLETPQAPINSAVTIPPEPSIARDVYDSGYYAPDDLPRKEPAERDSDEFFSAGSEEREKSKAKALESPQYDAKYSAEDLITRSRYDDDTTRSRSKYEDDDVRSVISSSSRYDDLDREERRRRRREAKSESREQSRDRGYEFDEGGERQRRHRRRGTDERSDDWDTKSTISEARSEANGERRRKHKRRESERDESLESKGRSRSSAASEPGDLFDDRKSSRRRSRRDGDDDNVSIISSTSRYDDDRTSKKEKEKEKRSSSLFGLFSKSKENLAETSSKSSKSKDDDDEERKHRRRKHRSDRGSTYGSDDDDVRSTISSSSRREKRSSRSERGEGDRRDSYDDKVHRSSYAR